MSDLAPPGHTSDSPLSGRPAESPEVEAPVVEAAGLGKVYRVYASPWDRLWEALLRRPRHRDFHALGGVDLALRHGEGLAIIGENGAGKSTLLKILAGITAPSEGTLAVRGKVASILELGSGFHPEFTGRQNIVLNAAMLGLSEAAVEKRMPEIIAFSELGDFIDQPVKCYSTGMAMRLGFSIATQVDPEILIIDEALSVGDGYFQKKCMDRLQVFVEGGGTLLFCSHAMYYVSAFCQRALWLKNGRVERMGPVEDVVRAYESYLVAKRAASVEGQAAEPALPTAAGGAQAAEPATARRARIVSVSPPTDRGEPAEVRCGEPLALTVEWETDDPELAFHVGLSINRNDGLEVCTFSTRHDGLPPFTGRTRYRAELELPALPLVKGEFGVHAFVADEQALYVFDHRLETPAFHVVGDDYRFGLLEAEHRWRPASAARSGATGSAAREPSPPPRAASAGGG